MIPAMLRRNSPWTCFQPLLLCCLLLHAAWARSPLSEARMRADLDYLASNELRGRLSMQTGADVAARFIAAEFEKAGLNPGNGRSFFQEFSLVAYQPGKGARLRFRHAETTQELGFGIDFSANIPRQVSVKAPLVFAGYGITAPEYAYDDYASLDVHGKIVLIFDHEPQETDARSVFNGTGHTRHAGRWLKTFNAQKHGAAGVLVAGEPLRKHRGPLDAAARAATSAKTALPGRTGQPSRRISAPTQALEDSEIRIPAFSISDAAVSKLLASSGKAPADLQKSIDAQLKPASFPVPDVVVEMRAGGGNQTRGRSFNVVGAIAGADPASRDQTVLVCAHYDHLGTRNGTVYPGANDNGSGAAALLELARAFQQAVPRPKRAILFVAFGSEEEGLLGSYYYVAHPLRPLAGTAVVNLDMIGRDEAHIPQSEGVLDIPADTSNEVNLVGAFYSPELRQVIGQQNGTVGLTISEKFDRDHALNALFRCDHLPFLLHDVPAVWLFGGFHPGYHEPSDTVDRLNFAKLMKIAKLAYLTTGALADAPSLPRFTANGR
jgi:hypothetical protein